MSLLKDGDSQAFAEIYSRFWNRLYATAFKRTDNSHDAEEIVQHVFVQLWSRHKTIDLKYALITYLTAAVQYEVIDLRAKRAKQQRYQQQAIYTSAEANSTLNQVDFNELLERMQQTLDCLPEKTRIIFKMNREEEYTYSHIANKLDISEKAVEKHMSRALRKLRTGLSNFFFSLF